MESFRFKVVKIISKEPFKRGRWLCMDFTDPPSNGTTNIEDCLAHNRPDIASSAGQGVSAVAIDNKIEQAMDLVKSHLMFAVREEMDVLKERICELTEKNSRLERENKIFRANATPETIQLVDQFNQQAQLQPRQSSPSQAQLTASLPPFTSPAQPAAATTSPQTSVQQSTSAITTINTINTISTLPNQAVNQQLNQQISSQISQQQISQQIGQQQLAAPVNPQTTASNPPAANQLT